MKKPKFLSRINPYIPLILSCVAILARILPGPRVIDDAYITFRYAKNILSGLGFTYNPGDFIQGTTTPLYTLLLSGIGFFFGKSNAALPSIAVVLNILADGLTVLLIWQIGKALSRPLPGLAAALFWAIAPFSVTFAIGGLETSLFVLLLTSSIYFFICGKTRYSAILASLSILTRPDGVILAALLVLFHILKKSSEANNLNIRLTSKRIQECFLFIIPLLSWYTFAWVYFGNPIPHSVLAKAQAYHLSKPAALIRFLQHLATPFMGHHSFGPVWITIGLILYPVLYMMGSKTALQKTKKMWPWIIYPCVYLLLYSIANPLIFRWYLTPPLLPYIFFIFLGLENLLIKLIEWFTKKLSGVQNHTLKRLLVPTFLLFPLVLVGGGWTLQPDHGPSRPAPKMAWYKVELLYQEAGKVVLRDKQSLIEEKANIQPRLAAADVGVLGYTTQMPILDLVGLNSHQALAYYPLEDDSYVANYAIPEDLVMDEKPAYLVVLEVYGRKTIFQSEKFKDQYRMLASFDTDIYQSDGMFVYKRSDLW